MNLETAAKDVLLGAALGSAQSGVKFIYKDFKNGLKMDSNYSAKLKTMADSIPNDRKYYPTDLAYKNSMKLKNSINTAWENAANKIKAEQPEIIFSLKDGMKISAAADNVPAEFIANTINKYAEDVRAEKKLPQFESGSAETAAAGEAVANKNVEPVAEPVKPVQEETVQKPVEQAAVNPVTEKVNQETSGPAVKAEAEPVREVKGLEKPSTIGDNNNVENEPAKNITEGVKSLLKPGEEYKGEESIEAYKEGLANGVDDPNAYGLSAAEAKAAKTEYEDDAAVEKELSALKGKDLDLENPVEDENKGIQFLKVEDEAGYAKKGIHHLTKEHRLQRGERLILKSLDEAKQFIRDSILKKEVGKSVAYSKVNKRLSDAVAEKTNKALDISDYYLELNPSNIYHSHDQHLMPKQENNIALTEKDFESIPEYINDFDEVINVKEYPDTGEKTIELAKKVSNGHIVIIETVSKRNHALGFSNMWGVNEKGLEKIKNSGHPYGRAEAPTTRYDYTTVFDKNVAQKEENSKKLSLENPRGGEKDGRTERGISEREGRVGRNVALSGSEQTEGVSGVSAEDEGKWRVKNGSLEKESRKIEEFERKGADSITAKAIPGQNVYIPKTKTQAMEIAEKQSKKAGVRNVEFFASDKAIETEDGELIRAGYIASEDRVFVRINDEDATADQLMSHELVERAIATKQVNADKALEVLKNTIGQDSIERIVERYMNCDADDVTDDVFAEAYENAVRELICDLGGGINQFDGLEGFEDITENVYEGISALAPYLNEKMGGALNEGFTDTKINGDPKTFDLDSIIPTITEYPERHSTGIWKNKAPKEEIRISAGGEASFVPLTDKSGKQIEKSGKQMLEEAIEKYEYKHKDELLNTMEEAYKLQKEAGLKYVKPDKDIRYSSKINLSLQHPDDIIRAEKARQEDMDAAQAAWGPKVKEEKKAEPKLAIRDLKKDVQRIFSLPQKGRGEINAKIEEIGQKMLKDGKITSADRDQILDTLYEYGSVAVDVETDAKAIRDMLVGRKIYVPDFVRQEYGEDWPALRQKMFRNDQACTGDDADGNVTTDKQSQVIDYIKTQPESKWKALWIMAGYSENTFDKKVGSSKSSGNKVKSNKQGSNKVKSNQKVSTKDLSLAPVSTTVNSNKTTRDLSLAKP